MHSESFSISSTEASNFKRNHHRKLHYLQPHDCMMNMHIYAIQTFRKCTSRASTIEVPNAPLESRHFYFAAKLSASTKCRFAVPMKILKS